MKPRNKFEKAVLAESKHLRPITKTQSKWAFRECIDHFAYRLPKGRTTCMDCGHSWAMEKPTDTCTCPHCGARLQVKETFERKIRQKQYFMENPLKVVPLIHSNLTPVKFSHSPFCLFLFSSYSSCPLCRVLH